MIRKFSLSILVLVVFFSCKEKTTAPESESVKTLQQVEQNRNAAMAFNSVGKEITAENFLEPTKMEEQYQNLKAGDSLPVKFMAKVNSVCKKKGCWMVLALNDEKEVMVKFKNYAFFVPKNIENKRVVVNGKAFVTEVSVEDQRHYAKDGGKSAEEIAAITKPKITWSFVADGVLIEK